MASTPFTHYSSQSSLHIHDPYHAAMLTQPANLRQALKDASKSLMGIAHSIQSSSFTKLLAITKPYFLFIDVEHGMFDRLMLHE